MKKKVLSFLLLFTMVLSLAACGPGQTTTTKSTSGTPSSAQPSKTEPSTTTSQTASGELAHMVVAFPFWIGAPPDTQLVEDALNEITRTKIGVEMELQISDSGSYSQSMVLALSGGETIDIMNTILVGYMSLIMQGFLKDLEEDDLLQREGQGIIDAVGQEYIDACRVNGILYGVPNNRDFAQGRGCAAVATEYLEGINYEFPDADEEIIKISLDELNDIYARLHEAYPDKEVYRPVEMSMLQFSNVDSLGGSVFGVLLDYGKEPKVENLFTSDYYHDYCTRMHDYYQKGYISKDAATDNTPVGELTKSGVLMSYTTGGKPGIKVQETALCGRPMTIFQTLKDYVASYSVASFPWSIPENTSDATIAMRLLNLLYTDADAANLLAWGIEGKHYVVLDNGLIDYPEGVDASTSGWNHAMGWMMPNQFITYVWNGNDPDLWEKIDKFNKEAEKSIAMGFTFDPQNVQTELTAVQNVYSEYQKSLEFGMVDPTVGIPEMNEKMMSAGLQKIIDEKQKQLDEWMKTKK